MSALRNHVAIVESRNERRFYPRVPPSVPIQMSIAPAHQVTLLNISENGFMVASLQLPNVNSVYRISLSLSGFSRAISVCARTVWVEASQVVAGIQLLDLNDDDRHLVREWVNAQLAQIVEITPAPLAALTAITTNDNAFTSEGALVGKMFGNISTHAGHDAAPQEQSAIIDQLDLRPTASPLIFWISALGVICLAGVWAFANNLANSSEAGPARVPAARSSSAKRSTGPVSPASLNSDSSQASSSERANISQSTAHPIDASVPTAHSGSAPNANSPDTNDSQNSNANIAAHQSGSSMPHQNPSVRKQETPIRTSSQNEIISHAETRKPASPSPSAAVISVPAPAATIVSSSTPSKNPAANNMVANQSSDAMPRTLSVDTIPRKPVSTTIQFPDAYGNSAGNYPQPSKSVPDQTRAANQSAGPANNNYQPTGKLSETSRDAASGANTISGSSSVLSTGSTSREAENTSTRTSNTGSTASASSSSTESEPRIVELNPSSRDSYVYLPGERVIQAPAATMRIQRSVWVRGGHWFWHGRKKVSLGQLAIRVDPQMPRNARYGSITVQASIDKSGRIVNVRPLYGSPAFLLTVSKAIRAWQFEPTYIDNHPVETQAKIEIDFHALSASQHRP